MRTIPHKASLLKNYRRQLAIVLLAWFSCALAEPLNDARMQVGINLFPAFLSARIEQPTGPEHVAVVFADHRPAIEFVVDKLRERLRRKAPDDIVTLISLSELGTDNSLGFTAVFIAQTLTPKELQQALAFANRHKLLSFSPLPGDVERGVLGGIAVSDRILPSLNMQTLREHAIMLKPFFEKVSDRYEPHTPR